MELNQTQEMDSKTVSIECEQRIRRSQREFDSQTFITMTTSENCDKIDATSLYFTLLYSRLMPKIYTRPKQNLFTNRLL